MLTTPSFFSYAYVTNFKQLLDDVLVISGIIKSEISVISRAEGRG